MSQSQAGSHAKAIPITPGAMATPSGAAKVIENKKDTKQLKETFEKMRDMEAKSKQHQVLEEKLKRVSLVLEKQRRAEEAQIALAEELAQRNLEAEKQNEHILQELARLEHEERVRAEVLKARQTLRQQYAIEIEDLRYKGLTDIPKETLIELKDQEDKVDVSKPIVPSARPAIHLPHLLESRPKISKETVSIRQSFQKAKPSLTDTPPQSERLESSKISSKTPKKPQSSTPLTRDVRGPSALKEPASEEKKPTQIKQSPRHRPRPLFGQGKEPASAYSSNGIPTKSGSALKDIKPNSSRVGSREAATLSGYKQPGWNASTNNSSSRRSSVLKQDNAGDSGAKNSSKPTQARIQEAKESTISLLAKKVDTLKAEKRAAKEVLAHNQKKDVPSSSRSRSKALKVSMEDTKDLIPNIKRHFEPALARSRTPKARDSVKPKATITSERNSQDTDQTSRFGTQVPDEDGQAAHYHSRPNPNQHVSEYIKQEVNYFTEPAGVSFQDGLPEFGVRKGSSDHQHAWIHPQPMMADSEVFIPPTMARDVEPSEHEPTQTFGGPSMKPVQTYSHTSDSKQSKGGSQHIKLVWSSADSLNEKGTVPAPQH